MARLPLSDKRIAEIIDEVDAVVRVAEDAAMRERLQGLRCSCCNKKMPAPSPTGECADCAVL